jgi:hypothetical protein
MIVAAALCPSPPLLVPELTGRAEVLPELRDACAAAVRHLLAAAPDVVAVVGAGPDTATWNPDDRLDLSGYGPLLPTATPRATHRPVSAPAPADARGTPAGPATPHRSATGPRGKPGLPLALGIGALLLDEAGYAGPRIPQAVDESAPLADCLRLGRDLARAAPRVALLAVGDGSTRRGPAAPGYLDERAVPFDDAVLQAVRDGDMAALAGLDPDLARDLMATGRAAWQVLAGAFAGARPATEISYAAGPLGVAYLVATLT